MPVESPTQPDINQVARDIVVALESLAEVLSGSESAAVSFVDACRLLRKVAPERAFLPRMNPYLGAQLEALARRNQKGVATE